MTEKDKRIIACRRLGMDDEEIAEMLAEDEEIDKMKDKEVNNDLTAEQKTTINKLKRNNSKKYEKSEEAKAAEEALRQEKRSAMDFLMQAVEEPIIIKDGKEFTFKVNGVKYRCTVTRVRKQNA